MDHIGVGRGFGAQVRGGAVEPVIGKIPFHDRVGIGLRVAVGIGSGIMAFRAPGVRGTRLELAAGDDVRAAVVVAAVAVHIAVDVAEETVQDRDGSGRGGILLRLDLVDDAAVDDIGVTVGPDDARVHVLQDHGPGVVVALAILAVDALGDRAVPDRDGLVQFVVLEIQFAEGVPAQVDLAVGTGDGDRLRDVLRDDQLRILARVLVELKQGALEIRGRDLEDAFHDGGVAHADGPHGAAVRRVVGGHLPRVRADVQIVGAVGGAVGDRPEAAPVPDILPVPAVLVPDAAQGQEDGIVLEAVFLAGDLPADQCAAFLELNGVAVAPGPDAVVEEFLLLALGGRGPVVAPERRSRVVRRIGIRGGILVAAVRIVAAHHIRIRVVRHAGIGVDGGTHVELGPLGTARPELHPRLRAAADDIGAARGGRQVAETERDGGHFAAADDDVRGGCPGLDFPVGGDDGDLQGIVGACRNGDEQRDGLRANRHALLAAIQRDAGRTGHDSRVFKDGEGAAEGLVGAQRDLPHFLAFLGGADLEPDDAAEVLERKRGRAAFGVHRRRVDVVLRVRLHGRERRCPVVVQSGREIGLEVGSDGFLTALGREHALRSGAFRGVDADLAGRVHDGDLVALGPEDVEAVPIRTQGCPGRGAFRRGGKGAGDFLELGFPLAGREGREAEGCPKDALFHTAFLPDLKVTFPIFATGAVPFIPSGGRLDRDGASGRLATVGRGDRNGGGPGFHCRDLAVLVHRGDRCIAAGPSDGLVLGIVRRDRGCERLGFAHRKRHAGLVQAHGRDLGDDRDGTGCGLAAVLGRDRDGGGPGLHGGYLAVLVDLGDGLIGAGPSDGLVGRVVRRDSGLQGEAFTLDQFFGLYIQGYLGDGNDFGIDCDSTSGGFPSIRGLDRDGGGSGLYGRDLAALVDRGHGRGGGGPSHGLVRRVARGYRGGKRLAVSLGKGDGRRAHAHACDSDGRRLLLARGKQQERPREQIEYSFHQIIGCQCFVLWWLWTKVRINPITCNSPYGRNPVFSPEASLPSVGSV